MKLLNILRREARAYARAISIGKVPFVLLLGLMLSFSAYVVLSVSEIMGFESRVFHVVATLLITWIMTHPTDFYED